tara:strand:- start:35837 stop:36640 length:804 start_codon:yes stop_codon:yes gene_type:complete
MTKKNYNFGEKSKENYKTKEGWVELEVWQTPKYLISKEKAIELIESNQYGLDEGDFWILKNQGGKKLCYTGLIMSHNGCLKINDKMSPELKFKPSSVSFVKDSGNKDKVLSYIHEDQGVYEFGEISPDNCKNDYPYAMVLKRLMDRVILKNSKVGFFGIYSEAESDDFKDKLEPEEKAPAAKKNAFGLSKEFAENVSEDMGDIQKKQNEEEFDLIKLSLSGLGSVTELEGVWESKKKEIASLKKYAGDLYAELVVIAGKEKAKIIGE